MANPVTYPASATDNGSVEASLDITIGAAGAVASTKRSREFASTPATYQATGQYTIFFKEAWAHIKGMSFQNIQATWVAGGAACADIITNNIKTTGQVVIQVSKRSDGTAVAPASGDELKLVFFLQKIDPTV